MRKNVLFLTYYFPPGASSGVFRPLKFVKYLKRKNWSPIVITMNNEYYTNQDETLLIDVPDDIEIHRVQTLEPFSDSPSDYKNIYHQAQLPDNAYGSIMHLVLKCLEIIHSQSIDLIFCTAPPHSLMLAAKIIKEMTGIPLVVDYRDGWNISNPITKYRSREGKEINLYLEKEVLKAADGVVAVDEEIISGIKKMGYKNPYTIIRNGFDQEDINNKDHIISIDKKKSEIIISYCGYIYNEYCDILNKLINTINKINESTTYSIKLIIAGSAQSSSFINQIASQNVTYLGHINYSESLGIENITDGSITIMIQDYIPSKIYNSMLFRNNLIIFSNSKNSAVRKVLKDYPNKIFLDINSSEDTIELELKKWLEELDRNNSNKTSADAYKDIYKYERSHQTDELISFFEEILN